MTDVKKYHRSSMKLPIARDEHFRYIQCILKYNQTDYNFDNYPF